MKSDYWTKEPKKKTGEYYGRKQNATKCNIFVQSMIEIRLIWFLFYHISLYSCIVWVIFFVWIEQVYSLSTLKFQVVFLVFSFNY